MFVNSAVSHEIRSYLNVQCRLSQNYVMNLHDIPNLATLTLCILTFLRHFMSMAALITFYHLMF